MGIFLKNLIAYFNKKKHSFFVQKEDVMEKQILSIKIENQNSIELNQLTLSLNALACQYDSFLRKSPDFDYHKSQRKLYLSKLENGSLIVELIPAVIPLLNEFNSIMEFGKYLKNIFDYFLGKTTNFSYSLTKKDCEEIIEFIEQSARDNGSNLSLNINGNNNTVVFPIVDLDCIKANAIQNNINKYSEKTSESPRIYFKELMYWANAGFVKNKINDKVIIEKIDKKPKKVIFQNEQDKIFSTTHNNKFPNKNWQDLGYIVDVEVSYIEDTPKEYKILKIYEDDTFDLD